MNEAFDNDNYSSALKITNGSYIMNGEFAVSTPGTYEAAGARFVYTREAGLDSVFALGPIQYDIDIMVRQQLAFKLNIMKLILIREDL